MSDKRKRIVIKVGSSTLARTDSSINEDMISSIAVQISKAKEMGFDVALVSSGAILSGLGILGITSRPSDMPTLQAAASVGQCGLSAVYSNAFKQCGITSSLVLLTRRDTADRTAYLHARDTLSRLLELGVVPVVNENDTISVEQIKFGDNDTLAALVACLIEADKLIILSDIDGLYDKNPAQSEDANLIEKVTKIDSKILECAGGAGSVAGSGGMKTKVIAARVLMAAGIGTTIVNGSKPDAILDALAGTSPHTEFLPNGAMHCITPRKLWVALGDSTKGSLTIDAGAHNALVKHGSSLLVVGIKAVSGHFVLGDVIDVVDESGLVIGRGLASASSDEVSLACGKTKEEIANNGLIAKLADKPIVHRDDLMIFE